MPDLFLQTFIYLLAAVVSVPVAKRLGLGSVPGYLAAGALIGHYFFGLVGRGNEALHVAGIGVVMMLFLIGMELQPSRLWKMRRVLVGLGFPTGRTQRAAQLFREQDRAGMAERADLRHDQTAYYLKARQHLQNLENLLRADLKEKRKAEASNQTRHP